jgi:protein O-GlcNAc transferase
MGLFDRFRFLGKQPVEKHGSAAETPREAALRLINEGNLIEEAGQLDEALRCYDEAISKAPDLARAHMNRGNILLAREEAEDALHAYQKALELEPDYAAAHYNAGNAQAYLNKHEAACAAYEKAILLKPDFTDAHVALGNALEDLGRRDEAAASYRRALEISPDYAEVHANLGKTLLALGQHNEGTASLKHATDLMPDDMETLFVLGASQKSRGQLEAALSSLTRIQAASPENIDVNIQLGDTLLELGQANEAIACYRRVIDLVPDHFIAHNNLGNVYFTLGLFDEAYFWYSRALELQPNSAAVHSNLGSILKDIGQPLESIKSIRRALEIEPEFTVARSNLLFIGHSLDDFSQTMLLEEAKIFGEIVARQARPASSWNNSLVPDRRLRIGFVSGDLCFHPVGFFIEGVLRALAARVSANLEIFAYMNFVRVDPVRERIKTLCHHWREVFSLPDEEVARLIQKDEIDILIDLSGHSAKNRLPLFAWKPAPVQVSWLGYFDTTGVKAIDYLIADPWTLPESEEVYFTETIWRLPDTRLCFTPPDTNVTIRPLPALTEKQITFGCFNNLNKMGDAVVALWARVLAAVPNSRLFLKARQLYQPAVRESVIEQFSRHGIDPSRLILEGPESRANYLAAYNRVDIGLDPFPYTGGTTTAEALWMGVPVLTLSGQHFLHRQGVGLLMNAGLPEWIASDPDDYVARALAHAGNLERLAKLRSQLREQVLASPIFDATSFAMHFDAALRGMWKKWCDEQNIFLQTQSGTKDSG